MRASLYCVSEDRALRTETGSVASRRGAQLRVFATLDEFLAHYTTYADAVPAACLVTEGDLLARHDAAFAAALRKIATLPVVAVAGAADLGRTLAVLGPGGWAVVDAPVKPEALDRAVDTALAFDRWRRGAAGAEERHALTAKLLDDLRKASAVELTAQLVHELSQPLTAIHAWAGICRANLKPESDAVAALAEPVERLVHEANRTTEVLRAFRALARGLEPEIGPCDLNACLDEVAKLAAEETVSHGIDLRLVLASHLPEASADPAFVKLATYILCRNAIDVLADRPGGRREIVIRSFAADGEVAASVADSGPGLDEAILDRLFKPVASAGTRRVGVGLAVCRTAVELLGGRLWLEANSADGACFKFALPVKSG